MKWFWDGDAPVDHSRRRFVFMGAAVGLVAVVAPPLIVPTETESEQYLKRMMQAIFVLGCGPDTIIANNLSLGIAWSRSL